MAVSGVSSSSSIYGSRNVISGLASGMDTESMIENAISAYKNKIASLSQKRTKTLWKQDAYRSIINKMYSFSSKYASYTSSNNLMSASFWNQAVKTVSKGKYADLVSATGRSSSNVQIDRVLQLATAATYKYSGSALDKTTSAFGSDIVSSTASGTLDLDGTMEVSSLTGSLTLAYGGSNALSYLDINFDDTTVYEGQRDEDGNRISAEQALANEINRQLESQSITIGNKTYTGKELTENVLRAEVKNGKITFADPKGNNVYISNATGMAKGFLNDREISTVQGKQVKDLALTSSMKGLLETKKKSTLDYLAGKSASMSITVDGVTKTVKLPGASAIVDDEGNELKGKERDEAYLKALQERIDNAFGKGKLTVSDANGDGDGIQFKFEAAKGSTFSISSSQGKALGFGESKQVTSYLNTNKTLGELLSGTDFAAAFEKAQVAKRDSKGNVIGTVDATDANNKQLYSFKVNGVEIGQFNEDSTLNDVMNAMNNNSASGVKVSYSKLTNELTFTAKETGAASRVGFSGLSAALFGAPGTYDDDGSGTYTKGQNAIFEASVNGTSLGQLERSSNSVDLDGMTVTLKGTFGYETDEDGNVKYDTSIDFTYSDKYNKQKFRGELNADGTVSLYYNEDGELGEKGNPVVYMPSNPNDSYAGKEIYGKVDSDGNLSFFMKNDKGTEKQVYLKSDGKFSIHSSKDVGFTGKVTKTGIKDENTEPVTFETSSDADKIVDIIKQMVEDYNAMVTEIKNAYSTLPLQKSNGAYYEPLTEDDEAEMSESAIKSWNENAKTGILFGDSDLRNLYTRLTSAISMTGEFGATLRAAGITVNYTDGLSTLEFNEEKFRTALNNDPDKVRNAFASSVDSGASANGLMQALKQPLDMYGKTSGGKGVLVEKAGSPLAASTLYSNTMQTELNRIDTQIEKWQDLMSNQIDYYTNQFSRLEQLIQQMNSQSSYFSQLMGY